MTDTASIDAQTDAIAAELPYLRRYARAITGSQASGDAYAVATLETILEDRSLIASDLSPRVALFGVLHGIWRSSDVDSTAPDTMDGPEGKAREHLSKLTPNTREALLLHTIEGFSEHDIGLIMQISGDEAAELVRIAREEMAALVAGSVLIIEDEPIIAMDLEAMVADMGHRITGNARTHAEAVSIARADPPALILADIQLADNSSGIEAVNEILTGMKEVPVIFITAFPERLLTGEKHEPAFMIPKPYTEEQVRSAVSQALFFSSTETLKA
ncbi:MAG: response regulator [Pseudomonadota bacterium]